MSAKRKQPDFDNGPEMERRFCEERRVRRDVAYQYEITLDPKPEHRFFVVFEFAADYPEANAKLSEWLDAGRLRHRECVAEGVENAPEAFRGLLRGRNFGKQLVKVGRG